MTDHKPDVKRYLIIFGALLILTVITVAVSHLQLERPLAIALGLAIATVKAALVIAFFMHLKGEHKLVYVFLGLMAFTLIGFSLIPLDQHLLRGQTTHTPGEVK